MLREHEHHEPDITICGEAGVKQPMKVSETQALSEPKTPTVHANPTADSKNSPSPTPSSSATNPFLAPASSHPEDPPGLFSEHSLQCPTTEPAADDSDHLLLLAVFDILESSAEELEKVETPSEDTSDGIVAQFTHLQPDLHCLDFLEREWEQLQQRESARASEPPISDVVASTTVVDATGSEYSLSVTFSPPGKQPNDPPPVSKKKGKMRKEKLRADVQMGLDTESTPRAKRNAATASRFKTQKLYSEAGPNGGMRKKK
ncbi:hypothetical protein BJ741DRAFT_624832 [Chytriomyces cf. hyalinus JEL632]|nr:hypothetical protein BJ741DRAFT_624832 [Chytriomyces cf. hyalinus JEL632]